MTSLSFDGMSEHYDETRVADPGSLDAALGYLADRLPPETRREVFEPGVGTGRVAIPLAERGFRVTGVDISRDMLARLRDRLAGHSSPPEIDHAVADVTSLPFADCTFDWAIAVHLFYFVEDWRAAARELLRVVKKDGAVVLMHTGTGAEIPWLNRRYVELCTERGCEVRLPGASSTRDVVEFLVDLGCRYEWIRGRWRWTERVGLERALAYIKSRAYSFSSLAPDVVHEAACAQLERDALREHGDLAIEIDVPNEIYVVVVTPPARWVRATPGWR